MTVRRVLLLLGLLIAFFVLIQVVLVFKAGGIRPYANLYGSGARAAATAAILSSPEIKEQFGIIGAEDLGLGSWADSAGTSLDGGVARTVRFLFTIGGPRAQGEAAVHVTTRSEEDCWRATLWYFVIDGQRIQISKPLEVPRSMNGCAADEDPVETGDTG